MKSPSYTVSFSTWCFPNSLSAAWSWQFPLSAEKEGYCSVLGQVIGISWNNTGLNSEDPIWILALILTCYMTLRKSLNLHFLSSTKWMNYSFSSSHRALKMIFVWRSAELELLWAGVDMNNILKHPPPGVPSAANRRWLTGCPAVHKYCQGSECCRSCKFTCLGSASESVVLHVILGRMGQWSRYHS